MTTIAERFWNRVDKSGDCWIWMGGRSDRGYGRCRSEAGIHERAHRYAYRNQVGPIPEGLTLDHLCRTRLCVNPDHLEPVTNVVNILRGNGAPAMNARKVACARGHVDWITGNGGRGRSRRICRSCRRIFSRSYRSRRATPQPAQATPITAGTPAQAEVPHRTSPVSPVGPPPSG